MGLSNISAVSDLAPVAPPRIVISARLRASSYVPRSTIVQKARKTYSNELSSAAGVQDGLCSRTGLPTGRSNADCSSRYWKSLHPTTLWKLYTTQTSDETGFRSTLTQVRTAHLGICSLRINVRGPRLQLLQNKDRFKEKTGPTHYVPIVFLVLICKYLCKMGVVYSRSHRRSFCSCTCSPAAISLSTSVYAHP
jgi:hypothetical protein